MPYPDRPRLACFSQCRTRAARPAPARGGRLQRVAADSLAADTPA